MPLRLRREEIVTLQVLSEKGESHCQVARVPGVTGGAVRQTLAAVHVPPATDSSVPGEPDATPFTPASTGMAERACGRARRCVRHLNC